MATAKQTQAALKNVIKAHPAGAERERTGGDAPRTRAKLYDLARQRDLPGRSGMGRDELARVLGED